MLPVDQVAAAQSDYQYPYGQPSLPEEPLFQTEVESASTTTRRRAKKSNATMIIVGVVLLLFVGVAAFLVTRPKDDPVANDGINDTKPVDHVDDSIGDDSDPSISSNDSDTNSDNDPIVIDTKPDPPNVPPSYAIQLDGRDYILLKDSESLLDMDKPFTVEVWARWRLTDKELALFGAWGQQADQDRAGWGIAFSPPAVTGQGNRLFLRCRNTKGQFFYYFKPMGQTKLDQWHHFAICNDTAYLNFFIDGESQFRFPTEDIAPADGQPAKVSIGSDPQQMGNGMAAGDLRGFRISSGIRYQDSFKPRQTLAADYTTEVTLDFSTHERGIIRDLSKASRHGSIVGATWLDQAGMSVELAGSVEDIPVGKKWASSTASQGSFEKIEDGWTQTVGEKSTEFFEVDRTADYVEIAAVVGNQRIRLAESHAMTWDSLQLQWISHLNGSWSDAGGTPTVIAEVDSSDEVDLLKRIDLSKHTFRGKTTLLNEVLDVDADGQWSQVIVPVNPPAEYELEAKVTQSGGTRNLFLGLVVGGRQCVLNVDASPGTGGITGLSLVKGLRPTETGYIGQYNGKLFTPGKESTIRCSVRPNEVAVKFDGKGVFKWSGNPSELSLPDYLQTPDPNTMFIGGYETNYRFTKLVLRPSKSGTTSAFNPTTVASLDKLPVPSVFDQAEGKRKVESILADDFAKANDADAKVELAAKLIEYAQDSSEEVGTQYVLLSEAQRLALEAANLTVALDAIDEMDRRFQGIDVWKRKNDALTTVKASVKSYGDRTKFAEAAVIMSDGAFSNGRIDVAIEVLKLATSAATPPAGNPALRKAIVDRKKTITEIMPDWNVAKAALDKLKSDAADADANTAWGRFVCFVQRDWDEGLAYLSKGSNAELKAAAQVDLDRPTRPDDQIALADQWWKIADSLTKGKRDAAKLRARVWYERAAPFATALLLKKKIEQRLEETKALAESSGTTAQPKLDVGVLPNNLPPEYAGMIGRMAIKDVDTGALFRYSPSSTIRTTQIDDLLRQANQQRPKIAFALYGMLHVPVKTKVTIRHTGGEYYETNDVLLGGFGVVSSVGGSQRDASGNYKRSDVQTIELKKGDYAVQWNLRGKYGRIGSSCDLQFTNEANQPLKVYHSKKMFTNIRGRGKDVLEIRLGS